MDDILLGQLIIAGSALIGFAAGVLTTIGVSAVIMATRTMGG